MRSFLPLLLTTAIFFSLALTGCSQHTEKDLYGDLFMSANNYYNGLRWQHFSLSAQALPTDKRDSFIHKREAQRDLFKVVGFEVRSHDFDSKKSSAVLTVDYRWYRTNDPTVRTTRMRQDWKYNDERNSWELIKQDEEEIQDEKDSNESKDLL
jgi:hypothetical protein